MSLKILLTGTTSSGKTTLIEELKSRKIPGVAFIEEEARKFLGDNPGIEQNPNLQDLLFARQVSVEQAAVAQEPRVIICDRGVPDNIAHALLFGQEIKPEWKDWAQTYDHVFFLNRHEIDYRLPTELQNSIDPNRDWAKFRGELDTAIVQALQICDKSYEVLTGTVSERMTRLKDMIEMRIGPLEGNYRPSPENE